MSFNNDLQKIEDYKYLLPKQYFIKLRDIWNVYKQSIITKEELIILIIDKFKRGIESSNKDNEKKGYEISDYSDINEFYEYLKDVK